jgi:predicted transcriptional regulator
MALKDDIFNTHIKKQTKKKYSHFRPFDDPNKIERNTNLTQIQHKEETKQEQSTYKLDTNLPQAIPKADTNHIQKDNLYNTQLGTNHTQEENNNFSIFQLSGIQKKIVLLIYESCKFHRNSVTPPISFEYLFNTTNVTKGSIKTSVQRLLKKGFLQRTNYKNGRAGWVQFRLPEKVYQELLNLDTSRSVFMDNKLDTQFNTTSPVVSSYINNTTTTMPEEFSSIDCSPLNEIGFTESHKIQIYREYEKKPHLALAANIVQDSINALAFDLKHNKVADDFKNSPVVVLISLLKKGIPYASKTPEKFKTPQQEAMDAYLAMKEQQHKLTREAERRAFELELESWQSSLTEEELLALCPAEEVPLKEGDMFFKAARRKIAKERARDYFEAEIWPAKKQEILSMG